MKRRSFDGINTKLIRQYFSYNKSTGELRWKKVDSRRVKVGDMVGCSVKAEDGRITVGFKGRLIRAHIIVWAHVTGQWPLHRIDHKNRIASDNRWNNLRPVDQSQNMANITRPNKANTSGYRGVSFVPETGKWKARIKCRGKTFVIGSFENKEIAFNAYKKASVNLRGQFSPYFIHQKRPS
jgi:hypothetical protein